MAEVRVAVEVEEGGTVETVEDSVTVDKFDDSVDVEAPVEDTDVSNAGVSVKTV